MVSNIFLTETSFPPPSAVLNDRDRSWRTASRHCTNDVTWWKVKSTRAWFFVGQVVAKKRICLRAPKNSCRDIKQEQTSLYFIHGHRQLAMASMTDHTKHGTRFERVPRIAILPPPPHQISIYFTHHPIKNQLKFDKLHEVHNDCCFTFPNLPCAADRQPQCAQMQSGLIIRSRFDATLILLRKRS